MSHRVTDHKKPIKIFLKILLMQVVQPMKHTTYSMVLYCFKMHAYLDSGYVVILHYL